MGVVVEFKNRFTGPDVFVVKKILYSKNNFTIVQGVLGPDKEVRIGVKNTDSIIDDVRLGFAIFPGDFTKDLIHMMFMSELTGFDFTKISELNNDTPIDQITP